MKEHREQMKDKTFSFIGKGSVISGKFMLQGTTHLASHLEGELVMSDDSKITTCTRRKPHPAIKIANFIANKKYNEEKGFVSKNTAMSAFKVLDTSKNCGNSIKAKRIINFADQYKNDKTVYRPVAKKNEVLKHYIT